MLRYNIISHKFVTGKTTSGEGTPYSGGFLNAVIFWNVR